MASGSFSKALRTPLLRQWIGPAIPRRSFVSAITNAKSVAGLASRTAKTVSAQQTRGVKTIDFAGHKEKVYGKLQLTILGLRLRAAYIMTQNVKTGLERSYSYVSLSIGFTPKSSSTRITQ